ncbi:16358_t:CDS:1, partial [Acaulospora colombiana]
DQTFISTSCLQRRGHSLLRNDNKTFAESKGVHLGLEQFLPDFADEDEMTASGKGCLGTPRDAETKLILTPGKG